MEQTERQALKTRDARAALSKATAAVKAADLALQQAVRARNQRLEQGEPATQERLAAFEQLLASWHATSAERRRKQKEYALFLCRRKVAGDQVWGSSEEL